VRLNQYALSIGLSYSAVYQMFRRGELNARQLPSGTIIVDPVRPEKPIRPKPRGFARTVRPARRGGIR